jgi:hypothetical protein
MHPEAKRLNDLSEKIIGAAIFVHRVVRKVNEFPE